MSRSTALLAGLLTLIAALGLGAYWLTGDDADGTLDASVSVADAMSGDTTGYRRAESVRPFQFPADHGPHPEFKNEWWYVTGNLSGPDGTPYGYELTIFRSAMTPPSDSAAPPAGGTGWRTNQFYMAHFALTDGGREVFRSAERFARGGAGLAGAQAEPFRVWLEAWSMRSVGTETFPVRLRAQDDDVAIDLQITPEKPKVLQGDRGLSQKGPGSGNASYYYSYTRLATEGTVVAGGDSVRVEGTSWLDREWSTSALGPNQEGWDWFALQLDDGRDLMYYQLRNDDGSPSRFSEGVLVDSAGNSKPIERTDVSLEVLDTWTTPDGRRTYPVAWRLRVPEDDLDLRVEALFPDQELDVSVRYWEGAVRLEGSAAGRGYVELTGYGDGPAAPTS
jgi:predicted secreted hydrolase